MIKKHVRKRMYVEGEPTDSYSFFSSNSEEGQIVGILLTDSYNEEFLREWLDDETRTEAGTEMIDLDKEDELIVFSSAYKDSDDEFKFAVTRKTFLKIFNEWNQARNAAKEFIVIEVSDDNDVHIYPMDHVEISPEERAEQDRIREEMWGKIESQGIFKNFFDGASSEEKEREKIYNLVIEGSSGPIVRNMFPSEWTREHVMEKIVEAFEYAKKEEAPLRPIDTQRFSVVGQTKEKVIIRMVLDKDANMLTAYPELL